MRVSLDRVLHATMRRAKWLHLDDDKTQVALTFSWRAWERYDGDCHPHWQAVMACRAAMAGRDVPGLRGHSRSPDALDAHWQEYTEGSWLNARLTPAELVERADWIDQLFARLSEDERAALARVSLGDTSEEAARCVGRGKTWMTWLYAKCRRILWDLAE